MREDSKQCFRRYKNGVMDALKFDRFEQKISKSEQIIFVCSAKILISTKNPTPKDDLRNGYLAITDKNVYVQQEAIWDEPVKIYPISDLDYIDFKPNQMSGAEFTFVFPTASIKFPVAFNKKTCLELYQQFLPLVPAQQEQEQKVLIQEAQDEQAQEPIAQENGNMQPEPEEAINQENREPATPPKPEPAIEAKQPEQEAQAEPAKDTESAQPAQPEQKAEAQPASPEKPVQDQDDSATLKDQPIADTERIDLAIESIERVVQGTKGTPSARPFVAPGMPISLPKEEKKKEPQPSQQEASVQAAFIADELLKLKDLLDLGLLTEEEFEYQKKKILSLR